MPIDQLYMNISTQVSFDKVEAYLIYEGELIHFQLLKVLWECEDSYLITLPYCLSTILFYALLYMAQGQCSRPKRCEIINFCKIGTITC